MVLNVWCGQAPQDAVPEQHAIGHPHPLYQVHYAASGWLRGHACTHLVTHASLFRSVARRPGVSPALSRARR